MSDVWAIGFFITAIPWAVVSIAHLVIWVTDWTNEDLARQFLAVLFGGAVAVALWPLTFVALLALAVWVAVQ